MGWFTAQSHSCMWQRFYHSFTCLNPQNSPFHLHYSVILHSLIISTALFSLFILSFIMYFHCSQRLLVHSVLCTVHYFLSECWLSCLNILNIFLSYQYLYISILFFCILCFQMPFGILGCKKINLFPCTLSVKMTNCSNFSSPHEGTTNRNYQQKGLFKL